MHYSEQTIRSFVIRSGKFTKGQKKAYQALHSKYCLSYQKLTPKDSKAFWEEQLHGYEQFFCEIGFGTGSATWQIAKQNPQALYLGVEVYRSGISSLMQEAEKQEVGNLRIIEHDAIEVLKNMLPKQALDGLHIFFPDPWPKKKHQKRRIVNKENIQLFCEYLKPEGYCYFVTDWQEYADSVDQFFNYSEPQTWRPQSKFEAKAIWEGRSIFELFLRKE